MTTEKEKLNKSIPRNFYFYGILPPKTNMTMENSNHERVDVFPNEKTNIGDFPAMFVFGRGSPLGCLTLSWFLQGRSVKSVLDLGCGDGQLLEASGGKEAMTSGATYDQRQLIATSRRPDLGPPKCSFLLQGNPRLF